MESSELAGILDFLRAAEALKTATRSGWTSAGQPESVADHPVLAAMRALLDEETERRARDSDTQA